MLSKLIVVIFQYPVSSSRSGVEAESRLMRIGEQMDLPHELLRVHESALTVFRLLYETVIEHLCAGFERYILWVGPGEGPAR